MTPFDKQTSLNQKRRIFVCNCNGTQNTTAAESGETDADKDDLWAGWQVTTNISCLAGLVCFMNYVIGKKHGYSERVVTLWGAGVALSLIASIILLYVFVKNKNVQLTVIWLYMIIASLLAFSVNQLS